MKKFLSLLTVFVLAFSLAVPASAVDVKKYRYGTVELTDIDTVWTDKGTRPYAVIATVNDSVTLYTFKTIPSSSDTEISYTGANVYYYGTASEIWTARFQNVGGNLKFNSSIHWSNFDIVKPSGTIVVKASEPVEVGVCDGTSCPATDVNIDGICDDCGMMLSLRSLTYPAFPSVDGSNKHYALVKTKYSGVDAYMYSVFTSDATYDIRGETPSTVYQIAVDGAADYIQYVTTDGQTWVEIQNSSVNNQSVGSGIVSQTTVIASTIDWYNEDGEHFFPVPLWEEVQSMTQGEMGNLTAETAGTMKTLVACGVGLMACLMALSLFGKRSLIFLR